MEFLRKKRCKKFMSRLDFGNCTNILPKFCYLCVIIVIEKFLEYGHE